MRSVVYILTLLATAGLVAEHNAEAPKTIVDLQPFRKTSAGRGATLVNLNPAVNAWFLLTVNDVTWHLENPEPREQQISLDDKSGMVFISGYSCDLMHGALEEGRKSAQIYYPLCDGRIYLRNPAKGQRTALEDGNGVSARSGVGRREGDRAVSSFAVGPVSRDR